MERCIAVYPSVPSLFICFIFPNVFLFRLQLKRWSRRLKDKDAGKKTERGRENGKVELNPSSVRNGHTAE